MLPLLTAWWMVGLWLGSYADRFPLTLLSVLLLSAIIQTWIERRSWCTSLSSRIATGAVLGGLLYWWLFAWGTSAAPAFHAEFVEPDVGSAAVRLVGRIVEPVEMTPERLRVVISPIDNPTQPDAQDVRSPRGLVRLTWREPHPFLYQGDLIRVAAKWHRPSGTYNPGGFDYAEYLERRGVGAVGSVSGERAVEVLESGVASSRWWIWAHLDRWRQQIVRAASASLDRPRAAVFVGLVTGDQGLVDLHLREAFNATGTVHLLSISGSHLGLLAAVTFGVARVVARWLPLGWLRRLNRRYLTPTRLAILVTIPAVLGYALLAGAEVATSRALGMIVLCLTALWLGRPGVLLPLLAASALLTVLFNPNALFDISFQLSYGAVLAMALLLDARSATQDVTTSQVERSRSATPNARMARLRQTLWFSVAVSLVTLPIVAHQFHQFPWVSPLANLLVLPAAAILVPLCLLSALLTVLLSSETLVFVDLLGWLIGWFVQGVSWLATLPTVDRHVAAPSVVTMTAYYVLVWMLWSLRGVTSHVQRFRQGAVMVSLAVLLSWWLWPHRSLPEETLRITMIDVGQGDATLVELPNGATMLIDAGARYDRYDVGAAVVGPLLWDRGIARIDHLIGTHPQRDHVGGVPWLLRHMPVEGYWGNGMVREAQFYDDLQAALVAASLHEQQPDPAQPPIEAGNCIVTLSRGLAPDRRPTMPVSTSRAARQTGSDLNNSSLMTRLECGEFVALFPADAEVPALQQWVTEHPRAEATLIKVPHHGARSSLWRPWIAAVKPQVALVSAGVHNAYHHPHPDVLTAYADIGADLYRTDRDGAVTVTVSPDRQTFRLETAVQQHYVPVSSSAAWWSTERDNLRRLCRRMFAIS
ncbi:MAG: DNA internalization-related competence protein ComEC/Rec2 [Nitrospiraceae bacterium]